MGAERKPESDLQQMGLCCEVKLLSHEKFGGLTGEKMVGILDSYVVKGLEMRILLWESLSFLEIWRKVICKLVGIPLYDLSTLSLMLHCTPPVSSADIKRNFISMLLDFEGSHAWSPDDTEKVEMSLVVLRFRKRKVSRISSKRRLRKILLNLQRKLHRAGRQKHGKSYGVKVNYLPKVFHDFIPKSCVTE